MLGPSKIDGFGTRRNASDDEVANLGGREQFVRFFCGGTIVKGNAVAIDFSASEPSYGWGNSVQKATQGQDYFVACGVAMESGSAGDIIEVQVYGVCEIAMCSDTLTDSNIGSLICSRDEAGEFDLLVTDAAANAGGDNIAAAVLLDFGSDGVADSKVFLLNPMNL
jgi:hypothetical protein